MKREVIKKLVKAMHIQPGQVVLMNFWGEEEDREILHLFTQEVAGVGGCPVEWMQSRKLDGAMFAHMDAPFSEKFYQIYDCFDVVIDIMMKSLMVAGPDMPREKMDIYRQHRRRFAEKVMAKDKIIQVRIPNEQNAMDEGVDPQEYITRMNAAYDIDYEELKKNCERKVKELEKKDTIVVTSGTGCKMTFKTDSRSWMIDAGEGDLPCGEIYIAPIENKTNGTAYFETIDVGEDGIFQQVTITVKDGKIVDSTNAKFNQFLKDLPVNGTVIAELGIGMNPNVKDFFGCSILDEKLIGSFHIAIGENRMFGGVNACPLHMDFVTMGMVE